MREVMSTCSDDNVETVVIMSSAQIGKTEVLNNIVGFYMSSDPCPILLVQPTIELAETWSKDRLDPMLRDTPILRNKVSEAKSRDSGNTIRRKSYPGGQITMAGANAPASLASRPVRVVLCDEVDRFPITAGVEGDPVSLARKRTATFYNRKILLTSTPTVRGVSRIEREFELSDKRYYHVACHHCDHEQRLVWSQVKWPKNEPEKAEYVCESCGCFWDDVSRWRNIQKRGRWLATEPFTGTAGFHLSEIYSPWTKLGGMARRFVEATAGGSETLKVFVNTALGESWEDGGDQVDASDVLGRLEDWGPYAPDRVLVVTAGVDVQGDRFEVERVGWGVGEESYSLDYKVMYGDPSSPQAWQELDEYLRTPTITQDGRSLPIAACSIDTGGHNANDVYNFVRDKARRKVWAIKGSSGGSGKPIWPKMASKNNKGRISNFFVIGVDTAKDSVYSRLNLKEPGPGYCHFPTERLKDHPAYFEQLTAEKCVTEYVKGYPRRVWKKSSSARNEALDCRVYAYASLVSLNVNWNRELKRRDDAERVELPEPVSDVEEEAQDTFIPVPVPEPSRLPNFRRSSRPSSFMRR